MQSDPARKTGLEDSFVIHNHQKLRCGYTTGTAAAAASKAAVEVLLGSEIPDEVEIHIPAGKNLCLAVEDTDIRRDPDGKPVAVTCSVRKDGGDDVDATDGLLIEATVSGCSGTEIVIDGGKGVGRVTRPGLDQPVGNAAINHVPREMMRRAVDESCKAHGYGGGISVVISVPEGEKIAEKTFNPKLGIVGGISILGTSGIVWPMSIKALLDTTRTELNARHAGGADYIVVAPGNYGERFAKEMPDLNTDEMITFSNFVGETIDMAIDCGYKGMLIVSHIGKIISVVVFDEERFRHVYPQGGRTDVPAIHSALVTRTCKRIVEFVRVPFPRKDEVEYFRPVCIATAIVFTLPEEKRLVNPCVAAGAGDG